MIRLCHEELSSKTRGSRMREIERRVIQRTAVAGHLDCLIYGLDTWRIPCASVTLGMAVKYGHYECAKACRRQGGKARYNMYLYTEKPISIWHPTISRYRRVQQRIKDDPRIPLLVRRWATHDAYMGDDRTHSEVEDWSDSA